MNRSIVLACAALFVVGLFVGCDAPPPPPAPKKQTARSRTGTNDVRTAAVRTPRPRTVKPRTTRLPKEALPGTIQYLDAGNGFRDVTFGQTDTEIGDLVVTSQDDARHLKTCVRSGDDLTLHGVPVESIEYRFHNGQLYAVLVQWNLPHADSASRRPPTTDLALHFAGEYGPARSARTGRDEVQYVWRGRKVELMIYEALFPGLPRHLADGWVAPPTTTGRLLIRNLALARAAETARAASGQASARD